MSDPHADARTALELKRRNAQELLARGYISREDYDVLGRAHGFVEPAPRSLASTGITVASVLGFLSLVAAASVEVVSRYHPELQAPLEQLAKLFQVAAGAL